MGNLDDSLPLTMLGGKMTLSTRLKPLLISGAFKPCENYVRWTSNIMGCYSDHFSNCGIIDAIHASQYAYEHDSSNSLKKVTNMIISLIMKNDTVSKNKSIKDGYVFSPGLMAIFSSLGILDEVVDKTYLATFLFYWLCEFVLRDSQKIISLGVLHMAAKLTIGRHFSHDISPPKVLFCGGARARQFVIAKAHNLNHGCDSVQMNKFGRCNFAEKNCLSVTLPRKIDSLAVISCKKKRKTPSADAITHDSLGHGDIPALPHADEVSVQWSQAHEEAFLNVLDAPSATSNLSSSITITGDLEQQVYLDVAICLVNGLKKLMLDADPKGIVDLSVSMNSAYTKLEEVGVDPTTLKHSIQELVVAAVEYDNSILTKKKVLSFAEGFDSHSAMVKAKTYELAILDLKISKLKEKRETSQKSLALDQSEAVKKKDELKLAKIDLQEAKDALSGEGIIFEKIFNESRDSSRKTQSIVASQSIHLTSFHGAFLIGLTRTVIFRPREIFLKWWALDLIRPSLPKRSEKVWMRPRAVGPRDNLLAESEVTNAFAISNEDTDGLKFCVEPSPLIRVFGTNHHSEEALSVDASPLGKDTQQHETQQQTLSDQICCPELRKFYPSVRAYEDA
ncbi:hypothetical protein ACFE04_013531 [Oxalis oulophora]